MTAKEAREYAYQFYQKEIDDVTLKIEKESKKGKVLLSVNDLPSAAESYLVEQGFVLDSLRYFGNGSTTIISWER